MSTSRLRVPFDAELPMVVCSESLVYGGKRYMRGDPFPWRALKIELPELWQLWQLCELDCVAAPLQARAVAQAPQAKQPAKHQHHRR